MKQESCAGFRCPEVVSPDAKDDFCIPEDCCPELLKTFKYPSPNSCLPEEVLKELEIRIHKANNFLLDLALSSERDKNEIFRRTFEGLIGQEVTVILDGRGQEKGMKDEELKEHSKLTACVFLAGRDFVLLRMSKKEYIIPYEKICSITLNKRFFEPIHHLSLNKIDPCLRRSLTFQFGEVVSGSPKLIHLFFGLDVRVYLLTLIDKKIKILLKDETLIGKLFDVNRDSFIILVNAEKKRIDMQNVCAYEMGLMK